MTSRSFAPTEIAMLTKILSQSARASDYLAQIENLVVEPIDDVGSLRLVPKQVSSKAWPQRHRFIDCKGVLIDSDGIPILICPFEDEDGMLCMLDVQKMGGGRIGVTLNVDQMRIEEV